RRHTRLVSDWSSDVCSSDLLLHHGQLLVVCRVLVGAARQVEQVDKCRPRKVLLDPGVKSGTATGPGRRGGGHRAAKITSEPRRVSGKGDYGGRGQVTWHRDLDVTGAGCAISFGQQDRKLAFTACPLRRLDAVAGLEVGHGTPHQRHRIAEL